MIPTPEEAARKIFELQESLTGCRRWYVGAAFFRPSHCPRLGEGSVRGEKMLGGERMEPLRSGGFSGIGCRSRDACALPGSCEQKVVTELDKRVLIEGPWIPFQTPTHTHIHQFTHTKARRWGAPPQWEREQVERE